MAAEPTGSEAAAPQAADVPPPAGEHIDVELAQSLGLAEALTIGIGTMIGAGIFVLPGFIIAKAGPAAVLSFLFGGIVALFTAMASAEVATGMPKSGGGYYFISRAMGPLWGAIIGWGSWFGLIFASAFYAVGFAEYVHASVGVPVWALALGMTLVLVILNLVGSKAAASAQNLIVAVLVLVMILFVGRGSVDVDFSFLSEGFMPFGAGAVFGGTATLFVTYCGFGEIASMAEEIKDPGKNLPRALIGSVVSVTILYCVVLMICVALRPHEELHGATIVADLAEDLMPGWGGAAILLGAVLATVSSANASIMSASRISFAMGRDSMMWPWMNQVHPRFRVPHRAVWVTGLLIGGTILVGDIEELAEAAGLLHLLMYGLMSIACIILRGGRPLGYRPVYRVPFYPVIPLLGAVGTLTLIGFMSSKILLMGVGLIAFAVAHYLLWAKKRTPVRGSWPAFVRRSLLEPSLEIVERYGGRADVLPTAVVAVRNPHREHERLRMAADLLRDTRARILATNVFVVGSGDTLSQEVLEEYRGTIEARAEALRSSASTIVRKGTEFTSHVPLAASALSALLSAAEVSRASLVFLGWPAPIGEQPAQYGLLADLCRFARAHVLVLREEVPFPPRRISVLGDDTEHGALALAVASRLASVWGADLEAVARARPDASADEVFQAEVALEERVGEMARAEVRAVPAASLEQAVQRLALPGRLVIVPSPPDGVEAMEELMRQIAESCPASLLLVRAHKARPIEIWMHE